VVILIGPVAHITPGHLFGTNLTPLCPFPLCRLTQTCFDKCIEKRYKEAELNMGENSCIDRCVSKYWQVTNMVGQMLGNRPQM
jgi:hypothetical protein